MGRSINREVSVSLVVGRPSRLMYPPGNLPAALVRSRYSTWRGKKSMPSRALPAVAATKTILSASPTTAPSACCASLPVSRLRVDAPNALSTRVSCTGSVLSLAAAGVEPTGREEFQVPSFKFQVGMSGLNLELETWNLELVTCGAPTSG